MGTAVQSPAFQSMPPTAEAHGGEGKSNQDNRQVSGRTTVGREVGGFPARRSTGRPTTSAAPCSHSAFLYLVNRLYRTLRVDLRSRFTTSAERSEKLLAGGRAPELRSRHCGDRQDLATATVEHSRLKTVGYHIQGTLCTGCRGSQATTPQDEPLRWPGQGHSFIPFRICIKTSP